VAGWQRRWHVDDQRLPGLSKGHRAAMAKQLDVFYRPSVVRIARRQRGDGNAARRLAKRNREKTIALGREPDVAGGVIDFFLEHASDRLGRPFAVDLPWSRAVDRLRIDGHPRRQVGQQLL